MSPGADLRLGCSLSFQSQLPILVGVSRQQRQPWD
jgi:hypothetical protein